MRRSSCSSAGYITPRVATPIGPTDVDQVAAGIDVIRKRYGDEEIDTLCSEMGPAQILRGRVHV